MLPSHGGLILKCTYFFHVTFFHITVDVRKRNVRFDKPNFVQFEIVWFSLIVPFEIFKLSQTILAFQGHKKLYLYKMVQLSEKIKPNKPKKITEQTEDLKSELFSSDFRQCPKSERFDNQTILKSAERSDFGHLMYILSYVQALKQTELRTNFQSELNLSPNP